MQDGDGGESLGRGRVPAVAPGARRGRGAASNADSRYERFRHEGFEDGWGAEEEAAPIRTEVTEERPRSIIARNASPDLPFDRSLNPYRGCEHGCVYCFARPTHAWLGLSPGLDFETRIVARPDAARVLARELARPGYRPAPLAIGTNTDPYQPEERRRGIMRAVLEVLAAHNHPVTVVTKGVLVLRDTDILGPMGRAGLARVALSVTSLDHRMSRLMEPRASAPARRLAAIAGLVEAGCPAGFMLAPVIPAINDHEIEAIVAATAEAGASTGGVIVLRLPLEVAGLFRDWLAEHFPDRARRVMGLVRSLHGGRDYDPEWGKRMKGEGPLAALIANRFRLAMARAGLGAAPPPLRTDLFRRPVGATGQLTLDL